MQNVPELPKYQSHKIVEAAKIIDVAMCENVAEFVTVTMENPCEPGGVFVATMPQTWEARHEPKKGDWFVHYEDGYCSVSPGPAFELGYHSVTVESFAPGGDALYCYCVLLLNENGEAETHGTFDDLEEACVAESKLKLDSERPTAITAFFMPEEAKEPEPADSEEADEVSG